MAEDILIKQRSRDIVSRFKRVIERNSLRYKILTRETIEQAMIDALNSSLPKILGDEQQSFFAYFDDTGEIMIEVTRLNIFNNGRHYFFNLNLLGEKNVRQILEEFQQFLDYAENMAMYNKLKPLKNGLIYGQVVRYVDNTATVEFYTDDGEIVYGFCPMRHLIEKDRDYNTLREHDTMLFYVRNIILHNNSRLDIQLSNRSKRIPELLLKRYLQEYGYEIDEYQMKCVYRIPGQFSKIVVLNRIDSDVVNACRTELDGETLRIIAIDNKSDIAKFKRNLLSFDDLVKNYDTVKKSQNKKHSQKNSTAKHTINTEIPDVLKKFMGV